MALTFTVAGLHTQLDAVNAAASGSAAEAVAFKAYALTYAGLVNKATLDGLSLEYPAPEDLSKTLAAATSMASQNDDRRRLGRVGLAHRA